MIFVTVGSDIPFDRLIRTVDRWAHARARMDLFAQIGRGAWEPEFISFSSMLQPLEFRERLKACSIVVGHAGMGTILSALQNSKPILVMPRRGSLGETRNDHQFATACQLRDMGSVDVAFDESELFDRLDHLEEMAPKKTISPFAGPELIRTMHDFIHRCERK